MLTSYKFWYIKRDDDIHISEAAIRFYEGEITAKDEVVNWQTKEVAPVIRYRRTKRLQKEELPHFFGKTTKRELFGDCIVFTPSDFGNISTQVELEAFLNGELQKDISRQAIDQQREVDSAKILASREAQ